MQNIGVVGAGAWGTALAISTHKAGRQVTLWTRDADHAQRIASHRESDYLPGVSIPPEISVTADPTGLAGQDALLLVTPAQHLRAIATDVLAPHIGAGCPIVICAKGIEQRTGMLLHDVVAACLPGVPVAALSGPSFADEVAAGLPAAVTLGATDTNLGAQLAQALSHRTFRAYWTDDIDGVELGGALKNVLAIAAGIVTGRRLGASAHAGLVTRGFSEMNRLGTVLGAKPQTLAGLSGLGDLMLTCASPKSRNMSLGIALGEGRSLDEVLGARRSVSEGVATSLAVDDLAKAHGLELPVMQAVAAVVRGDASVDDCIAGLLSRPLRAEGEKAPEPAPKPSK